MSAVRTAAAEVVHREHHRLVLHARALRAQPRRLHTCTCTCMPLNPTVRLRPFPDARAEQRDCLCLSRTLRAQPKRTQRAPCAKRVMGRVLRGKCGEVQVANARTCTSTVRSPNAGPLTLSFCTQHENWRMHAKRGAGRRQEAGTHPEVNKRVHWPYARVVHRLVASLADGQCTGEVARKSKRS